LQGCGEATGDEGPCFCLAGHCVLQILSSPRFYLSILGKGSPGSFLFALYAHAHGLFGVATHSLYVLISFSVIAIRTGAKQNIVRHQILKPGRNFCDTRLIIRYAVRASNRSDQFCKRRSNEDLPQVEFLKKYMGTVWRFSLIATALWDCCSCKPLGLSRLGSNYQEQGCQSD